MEIITFRNVGDKPVKLKNSGMGAVVVHPHGEATLPIEYATLNVGHPRAKNEGKNLWRDIAFAKARRRWGFYPGVMPEDEWYGRGDFEGQGMEPTIQLWTLDGQRLYSVLEDPQGTMSNPDSLVADGVTDGNNAHLMAQFEAMQKQIAQLTAMIAAQQNTDEPGQTPPAAAPAPEFDPLAAAVAQVTSGIDSAQIPAPPDREAKVGKDGPRTTRVGAGR